MTTSTPFEHPKLRAAAIGVHGVLTAWLLANGVGHEVQVIYKAYAGTLRPGAHVGSLLAVGAGLIGAGGFMAFTRKPLARAENPSVLPALASLGGVVVVVGGIAYVYGFTFLGGTIALSVIDTGLLVAHTLLNKRSEIAGA